MKAKENILSVSNNFYNISIEDAKFSGTTISNKALYIDQNKLYPNVTVWKVVKNTNTLKTTFVWGKILNWNCF